MQELMPSQPHSSTEHRAVHSDEVFQGTRDKVCHLCSDEDTSNLQNTVSNLQSVIELLIVFCINYFVKTTILSSCTWNDLNSLSLSLHLFPIRSLQICVILLSLLLIYDVFFVFITPYFTKVCSTCWPWRRIIEGLDHEGDWEDYWRSGPWRGLWGLWKVWTMKGTVRTSILLFFPNEEHHVWFFITFSSSPQNGVSIMVQVALGPDAPGEKVD